MSWCLEFRVIFLTGYGSYNQSEKIMEQLCVFLVISKTIITACKKDHIFLCACNSLSWLDTNRSLRSQGFFSGSLLFPKALPFVIDLPSNLSLFHLDVSPLLWVWCQVLQPSQGLLSFSPAKFSNFPGHVFMVLVLLDLF